MVVRVLRAPRRRGLFENNVLLVCDCACGAWCVDTPVIQTHAVGCEPISSWRRTDIAIGQLCEGWPQNAGRNGACVVSSAAPPCAACQRQAEHLRAFNKSPALERLNHCARILLLAHELRHHGLWRASSAGGKGHTRRAAGRHAKRTHVSMYDPSCRMKGIHSISGR
jgi:hypothetical protein